MEHATGNIVNAFTCTGAYAILIMTGLKRVENRSAVPWPAAGRCAVSVSKSFRRDEHARLMAWLRGKIPDAALAAMPSWEDVAGWPGHVVGTIDYRLKDPAACTEEDLLQRRIWDEGYSCWWHLANPRIFATPIPCRGSVGMWRLPPALAAAVASLENGILPPDAGGPGAGEAAP